ncbi:MAG: hypothetical protein L0338_29380, partial [Acidobacteria bacterium]|nr:hypothetical protein [Acidobacteriota bacterium]
WPSRVEARSLTLSQVLARMLLLVGIPEAAYQLVFENFSSFLPIRLLIAVVSGLAAAFVFGLSTYCLLRVFGKRASR